MTFQTFRSGALLGSVVLFAAGCGGNSSPTGNKDGDRTDSSGLVYEKKREVSIQKPIKLDIDAPRGDQKVTVTVTAAKPVSAYLYLQKNGEAVEDGILGSGPKKDLLLGSQTKSTDISFDATVPAKEPFRLYATADERTEANVKVVGR